MSSSMSSTMEKRDRQQEAAAHVGTMVDGKYDLSQLIAVGGVGAVYRARHRFTGRQVALKLLRDQFTKDHVMAERFLREAKAAAAIGHPCIIDVVDAGVDDVAGVYVAFELLEGLDLAEALKAKTLPITEILDLGDAVLDALEAAHRAGVVHRDIKPPNIFLIDGQCDKEHVRVLDFGAAKRQQVSSDESLTVVGTVIGTPAYMSPEQAAAAPVDVTTDIWAVGAVLFRAFADRPPFVASNMNLLLACIIRDTAPSLAEFRPDLPKAIVAVVDKALQRSPNNRWQSAEEMRLALRAARAEAASPVSTQPPPVSAPAQEPSGPIDEPTDNTATREPVASHRPPARNTQTLIGVGIAVVLLGAVLLYAALGSPRSSLSRAAPAATEPSGSSLAAPSNAPPVVSASAPTAASDAAEPSSAVERPPASQAPPGATSVPRSAPGPRSQPNPTPEATATSHRRVAPIREYE